MKKLVCVGLMTMVMTSAAFAEMKYGVVDMMLLLRNHPNYESNKTLLTSTDKDYQKKLEAIKDEGEKIQEEGKKIAEQLRNPMLLAKAKADAEKQLMEIQQKLMSIEQRYRSKALDYRQELQELEGRLLKTTTADIRKRLEKYAQENKYDLIFDSSATPYAVKTADVTDEMLKAMGVDLKDVKGRDESK